jgi:Domain of unknown function (DUF4224)
MSRPPASNTSSLGVDDVTRQPLSLTLTPEEILEITGYRRAHEQLRWFKAFGVPAKRRGDGTVSVAREHYLRAGASRASPVTVESSPHLRLD